MVTAANGWILGTHVHFQMLEEIVVFVGGERNQHSYCAGESCIHQSLGTTRNESGFLIGKNYAYFKY